MNSTKEDIEYNRKNTTDFDDSYKAGTVLGTLALLGTVDGGVKGDIANTTPKGTSKGTTKGTENLVTADQLKQLGWTGIDQKMVDDLNNTLIKYDIATPDRIINFISQVSHESGAGQ